MKLVLVNILKKCDWIHLNEGKMQWEALVSTVIGLPEANGAGNLLSDRATVSYVTNCIFIA
jgi:hypothetical protein